MPIRRKQTSGAEQRVGNSDRRALACVALVAASVALADLACFGYFGKDLLLELLAGAGALLLAVLTIVRFATPQLQNGRGRRRLDPLSPVVVVGLFLTLITLGRGLYVDRHGLFGLDDANLYKLANERQAFLDAIGAGYLSVLLLLLGDVAARLTWGRRQLNRDTHQLVSADASTDVSGAGPAERPASESVLLAAVCLGLVISAASFTIAVRYAGGIGHYLTVLGSREIFFAGRGWLFLALTAATGPVLAWFAVRAPRLGGKRQRGRGEQAFAALLVLAAVGGAWATGTRTEIVFSLLLPLLIVFHLRVRPLPLRFLLVTALCVFVGLSMFRATLRGSSDGSSGSVWQAPLETFASLDARLPDATASLLILKPARRNGDTLAAAFVAPVPRALWPSKPRSGNAQFTEIVSPSHYAQSRSEYGLTMTGELIWNFGWPGLAGFALLGAALASLHTKIRRRPSALGVLAYAGALSLSLNLLRTDLFTSMIELVRVFGPALFVLALALKLFRPTFRPTSVRPESRKGSAPSVALPATLEQS